MGYAARSNPCAAEGALTPRERLLAIIRRHVSGCETLTQFDALCDAAGVSEDERRTMRDLLPAHLKPLGTA